MRPRIPELLKLRLVEPLPRREDGLALDVCELGHPLSDVVAFWIVLFGLGDGIEHLVFCVSGEWGRSEGVVAKNEREGGCERVFVVLVASAK